MGETFHRDQPMTVERMTRWSRNVQGVWDLSEVQVEITTTNQKGPPIAASSLAVAAAQLKPSETARTIVVRLHGADNKFVTIFGYGSKTTVEAFGIDREEFLRVVTELPTD